MIVRFLGGVRTVTGSLYLISSGGRNILVECGIFQGPRAQTYERNLNFQFDPSTIDALLLSHAHIDHSGNIPNLVKKGFKGNIFCTHATRDLCAAMLRDSAHVLESDVRYVNKKREEKGEPPLQPLYTIEDVERCMPQFVGVGYGRWIEVSDGIRAMFKDAGHILGSAMIVIEADGTRLLFSGDIGRAKMPILKDPEDPGPADFLLCESTYGGRVHKPYQEMERELGRIVGETYEAGGRVVIPSFAVGRAQELVYAFHNLFVKGELPEIPIYVDSPLAVNVTEIFRLHPECFDEETRDFLAKGDDPFGFWRINYIRDVEDSKRLNEMDGPMVIISASGMCESGRILHHLKHSIGDPRNTIIIVGYQAQGTLGKRLVERVPVVRIFGEEYELRARVEVLNGFSSHADRPELLRYIASVASASRGGLKGLFIVHGDEDQSQALADAASSLGVDNIAVPRVGEEFDLG
jgi:metallo-beta-lactamase family protein